MLYKQGQIIGAFTQCWDFDGQHMQAIVQVGAKVTALRLLTQVFMGGYDDTHIGGNDTVAANTHNGARFDSAQQARLQVKRHINNFIEEKCAAMRLLKLTRTPLAICAGKSAALVAK